MATAQVVPNRFRTDSLPVGKPNGATISTPHQDKARADEELVRCTSQVRRLKEAGMSRAEIEQFECAQELTAKELDAIFQVPTGAARLSNRFRTETKQASAPRDRFDAVAFYGLKGVEVIGANDKGNPVTIGWTEHDKTVMDDKGKPKCKYNGTLHIIGLTSKAISASFDTFAMLCQIAGGDGEGPLAEYLKRNAAAIEAAEKSSK